MPLVTSAPAEMPLFQDSGHVTARDEAGAAAYGVDGGSVRRVPRGGRGSRPHPGRGCALRVCSQSDTADPERFETAVALARTAVEEAAGEGRKAFYVEAIPGGDRAAYELIAI